MIDADGDGTLSDQEIAQLKQRLAEHHAERVKRFDTDGDGKLSEEERREARRAMGERRRQGPPPPPMDNAGE